MRLDHQDNTAGHYLVVALKEYNETLKRCLVGQGLTHSEDLRSTVGFPHNHTAYIFRPDVENAKAFGQNALLWKDGS